MYTLCSLSNFFLKYLLFLSADENSNIDIGVLLLLLLVVVVVVVVLVLVLLISSFVPSNSPRSLCESFLLVSKKGNL